MKSKILFFGLLISLCLIRNAFPQITHLDTFRVVMSSSTYDYRNPVFSVLPYSSPQDSVKMIYEVRSGSASVLAWRSVDIYNYSNERTLINNGFMNINAAVDGNMVVWQSNKNGNWDLYYSIWSGSNWSVPLIIDSTSANETKPSVYFWDYGYSTHYIVYEKNNDVFFKFYRNGIWQGEKNLSDSISSNCVTPVFYGHTIYFLQETSPSNNLLCRKRFGISYPGYEFIWYPVESFPKPLSVKNIHSSSEFHYDYDTLGGMHSYMITSHTTMASRNMTLGFSGRNMNCTGSILNVPVQNNPDNDFSPYTLFGFQRRTSDSNMVVAQSRSWSNYTLYTKYFNLEDTAFVSKVVASPPIRRNWTLYKLRLIWEKKINGKIALVETFDTQLITGINQISTEVPTKFSLSQNYPNPFNPITNVKFSIVNSGNVKIIVYDVMGRDVQTLVNEKLQPGSYKTTFEGSGLNSGVYFYKLTTDGFSETKRMVLLK